MVSHDATAKFAYLLRIKKVASSWIVQSDDTCSSSFTLSGDFISIKGHAFQRNRGHAGVKRRNDLRPDLGTVTVIIPASNEEEALLTVPGDLPLLSLCYRRR
jgi:hypothetical protein